ncbi:Type IV secretion system protein virB10 [Kingella kingae]|nr:TrbI/VirB10 family protein [Kingella kingae]STR01065.1 Type IV secretion system protein virB10 [Kingella kingae]
MGLFKKKTTDTPQSPEIQEPTLSEKIGDNTIEKGLPNLENPQRKSNMGKVGLFLGLLFATGLIAAGAIVFTSGDDEIAATKKPEMDMVSNTQSHDFNQDKSAIKEQENLEVVAASDIQAASEPKAQEVPPINTTELPNHARQPETNETVQTVETPPEPKEPPIDPRLQGNVIVNVAGGGLGGNDETNNSGSLNYYQENSPFMATATQSDNGFSVDDDETEKPKENALASQLKPTVTPSVKAQKMGKRDFLLAKGTNILCTLDTQIITTRAGFTRCLITRDVYSVNGKVLLLEKGSKIIGEQTTAMLQGQARVGILWNEVTTPKGVTVSLASPAAGQLGAAGVGA